MTSKRWAKRAGLAVLGSVVARTVWLVGDREWTRAAGERELAEVVAATESSDPDWSWDRLTAARRFPLPDRNAADLIPRISQLLPPEWVRGENPTRWEPTPPLRPSNRRLTAGSVAAARQELARVPAAVTLARTLADRPDGNRVIRLAPDVLSTSLRDTANTRSVADLLQWDTVLAVEGGDRSRAAADLSALLHTSRSIGDEPMLVSQLVRIACRSVAARSVEWALGQGELPEKELAALQSEWAADADEPLLLYGVRGERAAYDVLLRNLADGTVTPDSIAGRPGPGVSFTGYSWWLYRGRVPRDRAFYHRWMTQAVQAARLPVEDQPAAVGALPPFPGDDLRFAQLFLPAVGRVGAAYWRSVAEARCVAVGLACERFRVRTGRWPVGLADLPADGLRTLGAATGFAFLTGFDVAWGGPRAVAGDKANADKAWGTLKGRVVFDGDPPQRTPVDLGKFGLAEADRKWFQSAGPILSEDWVVDPKTKGVRWVFVWVTPADPKAAIAVHPSLAAPKDKAVVADQDPTGYVPHAIAVRAGQDLVMRNAGPVGHVFNFSGGSENEAFNRNMIPKSEVVVPGLKAEKTPIQINCPPHPWERAWLRVFAHPYFAVTDADGRFEIPLAPAGPVRVVVWQESLGFRGGKAGRTGIEAACEGGAVTDLGDLSVKPTT